MNGDVFPGRNTIPRLRSGFINGLLKVIGGAVLPKSASEYSAALLEGLNEGVIAFDLQRKAVLANGASIRLLGLAGQEVTGRRGRRALRRTP